MTISLAEWTEQLATERRHLIKADRDIEEGWQRIRDQEDRVRDLSAGSHEAAQAERLAEALKQTQTEWLRHRVLIEERIAYLRRQVGPE